MTQDVLARRVYVSRGYIAGIEIGRANPTLEVVERIAAALDVQIDWYLRAPMILDPGTPKDHVHARCSLYVDRRLRQAGLVTAREVEIVHGRSHGWIDLLAYDLERSVVVIVEIKTRLDDLGALERQVGWYERSAIEVAHRLGWRPRHVVAWVLVLATTEVDAVIHADRELFDIVFPVRARQAQVWLEDRAASAPAPGRALAMVDPLSRRADWLIRTRPDGRRSEAPYRTAQDAAARMVA